MKIISLLFVLLNFTTVQLYSQSGWTELETGIPANYRSIHFPSINTGYAVGNSPSGNRVIAKTTNAGNNWQNISISLTGTWWRTFFINDNTGFVTGTGGIIMKTTDGGSQWALQNSGITNILWTIYFTDENTGYGGAESGKIIKTTNGGSNWFSQVSNTSNYIESFFFFDSNTGFACGRYGTLLKTTNGGDNWLPQNMGTSKWFYDIDFPNSQTGYIGGGDFNLNNNIILKTTNGGTNWFSQINSSGFLITGIDAPSPDTVYASVLSGFVLKTTNGGTEWLFQNVVNDTLDEVFFINNTTGFVCSYSDKIFKTTTGGIITSISQIYGQTPDKFSLRQNYPNPFNPETIIRFDIPKSEFVTLEIYNILGEVVSVLVNEELNPGSYEYTFNGSMYSSGIYFYKIIYGDFIQTKRMLLVK